MGQKQRFKLHEAKSDQAERTEAKPKLKRKEYEEQIAQFHAESNCSSGETYRSTDYPNRRCFGPVGGFSVKISGWLLVDAMVLVRLPD